MSKQSNSNDPHDTARLMDTFSDALEQTGVFGMQQIVLIGIAVVSLPVYFISPVLRLYAGLIIMGILVYLLIKIVQGLTKAVEAVDEAGEDFRNYRGDLENDLRKTKNLHLEPLKAAYQELESKYNLLELEHKKLQEELEKFRSRIREGEKSE